jgi:anti-sigma factor RsiW
MKPDLHPDDLDRLVDGEGAPAELARIEAHLVSCPACRAELAAKRNLSAAIRREATRHAAPAALKERWRTIPQAGAAPIVGPAAAEIVPFAPAERRLRSARPRWLGIAASAALAAVFSGAAMHVLDRETAETQSVADAVVSSHIRSLAPGHLYDVESTDRHTVKPWFNGKLSFSPTVKDMTEQGFPLLGGRLDYIGRQDAAALVYRHDKHIINVFVWPEAGDPGALAAGPTEQGFNTLHWHQGGMAYWAVSDENRADLQSFADHFRD